MIDPPNDPGSAALWRPRRSIWPISTGALVFADRAPSTCCAHRDGCRRRRRFRCSRLGRVVWRWHYSYIAADEAYRLAVETRQPVWAAHARLGQADLEGRRGRTEQPWSSSSTPSGWRCSPADPPHWVASSTSAGSSSWAGSDRTRPTSTSAERWTRQIRAFHSVERLWLVDSFAEAAARSGHVNDAREVVAALEPLIDSVPSPGYHRAIGLARVLLADDRTIDEQIARTRQAPGRTSTWFEARIDLAQGMSLRRRRRGVESRRPLSSALTVFTELGAAAWAQRAAAELAATGAVTAHRNDHPYPCSLPGTAHRPARGPGFDQSGDRRPALPVPPHRRIAPVPHLSQAQHHLPEPVAPGACAGKFTRSRRMTPGMAAAVQG